MKQFKELRKQLNESIFDKFFDLFKDDKNKPLDRSRNVIVRPKDMRHESARITVMMKKHKDYRTGKEAYDWTLREPAGAMRRYTGTLKKKSGGGWIAMGIDENNQPKVEIENHGDSLKAIKKIYKSLSKSQGSAALSFPIISRGNAASRPLTK